MKTSSSNVVLLLTSGALCLGAFGVGFATSPLAAVGTTTVVSSQVIARDIPTYTREARSVVLGTVVSIGEPYQFDLGVNCETTIRHDVRLKVERVLRGESQSADLSLIVEGGTIGMDRVVAEDEAAFRVGERVIVFVGTNEDGDNVVFAGAYGKLTVSRDGDSVVGNAGFQRPLQALIDEIQAVTGVETDPG